MAGFLLRTRSLFKFKVAAALREDPDVAGLVLSLRKEIRERKLAARGRFTAGEVGELTFQRTNVKSKIEKKTSV